MNVISKIAILRFKLKIESDPHPLRVVRQPYLLPKDVYIQIQMGDYLDEIYCSVLTMDVAHVLLGRPWLYN